MLPLSSRWFVYILRCADASLYTGVTTDIKRRLDEHNGKRHGGARYTRGRRPVTLVYLESAATRSDAGQREVVIKRLAKARKEALALQSMTSVLP